MECDICGTKDDLVKVKTEDDEIIHLCRACYQTQYEGYEASNDAEWEEDDEDDWEEDSENDDESFGDNDDLEEDELDNEEEEG
ncbi:MAG: hypothetical protein A2036_02710 [Omnitrophica bacterium GWA2_50_21]|nr:MAG: hypothetical protein A2036_02710 [Omnitrophica bacterium GWA2_50_21]